LTFVPRFGRDRPKFCKTPSTFFKKKGEVASRFVSSIPAEEFGQDLRESEPGDLLPGSGREQQFFFKLLNLNFMAHADNKSSQENSKGASVNSLCFASGKARP